MVQAGSTHGTSVEWPGQLVARGDKHQPLPHVTFGVGCTDENKERLQSDTQLVVNLINKALKLVLCVFSNRNFLMLCYRYLEYRIEVAPRRYETWFGELDSKDYVAHLNSVKNTLYGMLGRFIARYDCELSCSPDTIVEGHFVM